MPPPIDPAGSRGELPAAQRVLSRAVLRRGGLDPKKVDAEA